MTTAVELNHALNRHPAQAAFWRQAISRNPEPTVLPRDLLGQDPDHPTADVSVPVGSDVLAAARRITRGDPTLTRVLHLAVLAFVAARATDTGSVWVSAADRGTLVPLTVAVEPDASFRQLLSRTRNDYLKAQANLDVPVHVLFEEAGLVPGDLALAAADAHAQAPLSLRVGDDRLELRYRSDLFTEQTAQRLAACHRDTLAAAVADVDAPLRPLLAASPAEQSALAAFNDTCVPFPDHATLHGFLARQAARTPDRVAIVDSATTYGRLDRDVNRLAHRLIGLGVRRGDIVGVCLPRSGLALTAIHAVLRAGAAYLPIDPALPRARIDHLLGHSGARILLGDPAAREVAGSGVEFVDVADPAAFDGPDGDPGVEVGPEDLAYVIYTSGSTGRPKGVMVEHRAIVNRLTWMQRRFPLGADDVVLHKTPSTFDVSVWEIFWWSLAGAAVATLAAGAEKDPERIATRVAECGVTTMHFVPSMLAAFLQYGATDRLGSLRRVFASGEALATAHVGLFRRLLPEVALVNLYGPTEAAVDVTCFDCAGTDPRRLVPIGRPIDNIALRIVTRSGAIAPVGTPGELCITGTGLARGYLNASELTRERFVPDVLQAPGAPDVSGPPDAPDPARRMYRTGDLARWLPGGDIEYLGRIDTQVKIRGYRIEPGEIEHVAVRDPGVAECAVAAVEDGSGDRVLAAYVVTAAGFSQERLRALLAAELPAWMVPRFVTEVPAIPTGHNGKRDLKALPPPGPERSGAGHAAPRDGTERQLARIWEQALGVPQVGVQDNFFALGGDSIKFIRVLAAARAAGMDFSFQDLFAHPVIAELAALVRDGGTRRAAASPQAPGSAGPAGSVELDPADRDRLPADAEDAFPMSALQAGLCYETARRGGAGLYHDVASYRVPDRLDVAAFRTALAAVVARHAVLRTSFHPEGFAEPIQIVHRRVPLPLRVFDLSGLTRHEQDAELDRFHAAELAQGFQPGATDLVRVRVHLLGDRGYQYSLSYHAGALDGWSVATLNRDLFEAYDSVLAGRTPQFRPCATTYRDFIRLEREAVASPEQRRFWTDRLAGASATAVPRSGGGEGAAEVVFHDVELGDEVAAGAVRTAAALRVPVKSVLLAAHVAVLGLVGGTDDVLTGYEHSGRPEAEGAENLPGQFLNTIPFRARVAGTWAELIASVYRAETDLLPHRRYPTAEVNRRLGVRAAPFEAVFNFTHFHVLKDLGFGLVRSAITSRTEFPFRAEFSQDALTDEVRLALHYDAARYRPEHIARIGGYYVRALELITTRVHEPHDATGLLGDAERAELARLSAGPHHELPPGTFLDVFAATVGDHADEVAVSDGARSWTYRELDGESERVASHLAARGVEFGDVVGVATERGLPWAAGLLAVMKLGAVYLPLNPEGSADRLARMLRRADCRHVLGMSEPAVEPTIARIRYDDARLGSPHPVRPRRPGPQDAAYVLFTSGSTGEPKGAVIHHLGMLNHLTAKRAGLDLRAGDVVAQVADRSFDISVWQLLAAWTVGGRTVIIGDAAVAEPARFLDTVREQAVTVLEVVPSYLDALLAGRQALRLPALRRLLVTGEALPPALTRRWFAHHDVPMVNAYGPTEASDDITHHILTGPVDGDRVPVGRPVANTRIHVARGDGLAPIGSYGEICVTGPGVGLGYVNDPDRTDAVFRTNPFDDASPRMYRTGDIGRWLPDGTLDCAGRVDHQVKIRGFRIELTEIEAAVSRLDGVSNAVAVAAELGGAKVLVVYYTGPREPEAGAFRAELARGLPAWALPDIVVRLASFPLTDNGKIDRNVLQRREPAAPAAAGAEPAADPWEQRVLDVYCEVLGAPAGSIGATDGFFDVGGHSLAAMRAAALLGGSVTVRDLLAHPTARGMAARLRDGAGDRRDLLVALGGPAAAGTTLVCFPYAGGSAVSYLPVARAVESAGLPVRVLALEPPGRTREDSRRPVPPERLAADVADEIAACGTGVVLLGHSAGAGHAIAAARELRTRGVPVRQLFIVSSVLRSADPEHHLADETGQLSDAEIADWLTGVSGLAAEVPDDAWHDIAGAFRHDSLVASGAYAAALRAAEPVLDIPVTVVLATDDPVVAGHEHKAADWRLIAPDLRIVKVDGGGHYLNTTRAGALAAHVAQALGAAAGRAAVTEAPTGGASC